MARRWLWQLKCLALVAMMATRVSGGQVLQTSGFSDCGSDTSIKVDRVNISYNNENKTVVFDVAGSSRQQQNVTAVLNVTAYGNTLYTNSFNPCDKATFVDRLCPLPAGNFAARGSQQIPAEFAKMVPAIAFSVPDISARATLSLLSLPGQKQVACIQSDISNGKSTDVKAVSVAVAGVTGFALVMTGFSAYGAAMMSGGAAGSVGGVPGAVSPSFYDLASWSQSIAMNSMLSVSYPPIYRNFAKNFAFSVGLIPLSGMQKAIDGFRQKTGGNLTEDSHVFLQNATLIFPDGQTKSPNRGLVKLKRAVDTFIELAPRATAPGSPNAPDSATSNDDDSFQHKVKGIQAFSEQFLVPKSNIFMTVLLIVAIIIVAIVAGLLLVKLILEAWALKGTFPESLKGFRKHYWGSIARTITSLILLLYGVWVLYCVFQFTHGDSAAVKAIAGVTLGIFTGVLAFFSWKIWSTVRELKKQDGNVSAIYDDKSIWVKYSLFYDSYKKQYWWLFVPVIFYMFAKGLTIAAADGRGLPQTIIQLVIEGLMLGLLVWSRPFERRAGNILNIAIQVVRFLSIICILIFVEELGIKQTTQTVAGIVLIAVQATLTAVLVILIAWNAISICCTMNPHRRRRKEAEQLKRDMDNLTPLDARNSLLLDRASPAEKSMYASSVEKGHVNGNSTSAAHYRSSPSGDNDLYPPAGAGGQYGEPFYGDELYPSSTHTDTDPAARYYPSVGDELYPSISHTSNHAYQSSYPGAVYDAYGLLDDPAPPGRTDSQRSQRPYQGSQRPQYTYGSGRYQNNY